MRSCGGSNGGQSLRADQPWMPNDSHPQSQNRHVENRSCVALQLSDLLEFSRQEESLSQVEILFPKLQTRWPEEAFQWSWDFLELLPEMPQVLKFSLRNIPSWKGEQVEAVHIYVDGSSMTNRQGDREAVGAWAFIVLLQCRINCNETYRFYVATTHALQEANMTSHEFHGFGEILHDSTSAEASGMIAVQCWIRQSPFRCEHHVHYDNKVIGELAAGRAKWNATWEHSQLRDNISSLRHCLTAQGIDVKYSHVKAHTGHPINEAVDNMAKATVRGILPKLAIPLALSQVMQNRNFKHVWIMLVNSSTVPKPSSFHAVFKAEGPFPGRQEDVTWIHEPVQHVTEPVTIKLSFATANVLTLAAGASRKQHEGLMQVGRIATLQAQFSKAAHHIIGVQECRTQGAHTRHSTSHFVFQSGAHADGSRGCELWIDKSQAYAHSRHQHFRFAAAHFHIASYSDRRIMAIIKAPHLQLRVLVLHAPHQGIDSAECRQWWNDVSNLVQTAASHLPLVILGDLNAKVGSVNSDSIGEYGAEEENTNGHMLHSFMIANNMWAPSTFASHHSGPHATWTSSSGTESRIDYILLPMSWIEYHSRSYIQEDVDLCTVRQDHSVVALDISMHTAASTRTKNSRINLDVRKCSNPEAVRGFKTYLATPPAIPWSQGVGEHAEALTAWFQKGAKKFFARGRDLPKQRYMSEATWNIVQLRKKLMKHAKKSWQNEQAMLKWKTLRCWWLYARARNPSAQPRARVDEGLQNQIKNKTFVHRIHQGPCWQRQTILFPGVKYQCRTPVLSQERGWTKGCKIRSKTRLSSTLYCAPQTVM